jgi:hypothetical protein
MLLPHPKGQYRFLKGIDPYSCGVVAEPGWEIVHVTLSQLVPWREGFDWVSDYLQRVGRDRCALCAMELRSPKPFTMEGFIEFNRRYCAVLKEWGLYLDGLNPVARTNVAPVINPPATPSLHAFSYTRPAAMLTRPTFVVAGAGELRDGFLEPGRIIRPGETTPEAMAEKSAYVMQVMEDRLNGLGGSWDLVTAVDVYTAQPNHRVLETIVLPRLGVAARHGVRLFHAQPPIVDIEFEMDLRGVCSMLVC